MYTALQDITIDKIDFDWINKTTKISHLKRAIRVIQIDGDYYKDLKDACYKRIQQIDPSQKRVAVSNAVSQEFRKEIENQLLDWEKYHEAKEIAKLIHQTNNNTEEELKDYEAYFTNEEKGLDNLERKLKMAEAQRIKGNQAIKSKDFQQAITYYTNSLQFDPKMYQSYSNRALAYLKTKQFQKCIDDCDKALEIDSKHIKAYHRKAKALVGLNRKVESYRVLQLGQTIEPENIELTKQLKELREEMSPDEIKELDSHLIPKSQFRKITIEEDSDEDDQ